MRILVLSDSHGNIPAMVWAVEKAKPEMILHLGDCWRDAENLHGRFPKIPLVQVPGNCDFRSKETQEKVIEIEGVRILLCHGHTYGVKQSLTRAGLAAEERDLDVFLFGHTHRAMVERRGKTLFMNPGSIGEPFRASYGILTIAEGAVEGETISLK